MQSLAISLLVGAFIFLLIWTVYNVFSSIPEEDRSYLDQPPLGFKLLWPLIKLFVYYFGSYVNKNYRLVTHMRIRRAGMDYALSAEQFFAGKVIAALVFALLSLFIQIALEKEAGFVFVILSAVFGFYYPEIWLKETTNKRDKKIFKDLPFYLDLITLSIESGTNLTGGISQSVQKSPEGPLKLEFNRVLRDVRAGKTRADALREMTDRISSESVRNVVSSMIQAEKAGSSLGPVLRAQADQLRSTRFLKAEKVAMEAPVKLLGPLVMFIFPNTFLVITFLLISQAIQKGVLTWSTLVRAMYWPG
jgi:tight adherence protein C